MLKRKPAILNIKRRTLIKAGLFGAAAFALGKIFGPGLQFFEGGGKITDFRNFRVVEKGDELGIYDQLGNEILVMDNK